MEHAEAHERLSDLALEPGRLARLETDPAPGLAALREHVAGCEPCAADLAGWRRTWAEVAPALAAREPIDEIHAPAALRATTLRSIRAAARADARGQAAGIAQGEPAAPAAAPAPAARLRRVRPGTRVAWLVAAAAIVIALVGGSVGLARTAEVAQLRAETGQLEAVAATFDRVLGAQKHWTVTLRTADGAPGGTMAWSTTEIVAVTTGLPAPGEGQVYRCWVELNGNRTPMGEMSFTGSTGYWVGTMALYESSIAPGARYGVSITPAGGQATPVLVGTL